MRALSSSGKRRCWSIATHSLRLFEWRVYQLAPPPSPSPRPSNPHSVFRGPCCFCSNNKPLVRAEVVPVGYHRMPLTNPFSSHVMWHMQSGANPSSVHRHGA